MGQELVLLPSLRVAMATMRWMPGAKSTEMEPALLSAPPVAAALVKVDAGDLGLAVGVWDDNGQRTWRWFSRTASSRVTDPGSGA